MNQEKVQLVSTVEELVRGIRGTATEAVGIIILGADCRFKKEIVEKLQLELHNCQVCRGEENYSETSSVEGVRNIIVVLDSDESRRFNPRHQIAYWMKIKGRRTVLVSVQPQEWRYGRVVSSQKLIEVYRFNQVREAIARNCFTPEDERDFDTWLLCDEEKWRSENGKDYLERTARAGLSDSAQADSRRICR